MRAFSQVGLHVWGIVALAALNGFSSPIAATARYEQSLYDLGAFPVYKLTKPYWTNGNAGKVYGKGERVDVDGWLPPYWAAEYLTDAEKRKYGIPRKPLSYGQYMAMIDIDTYKRTHDPQLFVPRVCRSLPSEKTSDSAMKSPRRKPGASDLSMRS